MTHFPDRPLNRILYKDIPSDEECRRMFLAWKDGTREVPDVRTQKSDEYFRSRRRGMMSVSQRSRIPQQVLGPVRHVPYKERKKTSVSESGFVKALSPEPLDLNRIAASRAGSRNETRGRETAGPSASSSVYASQPQSRQTSRSGSRSGSSLANRCPLCRTFTSEEGGLCGPCKREFAISDCSFMMDEEEGYTTTAAAAAAASSSSLQPIEEEEGRNDGANRAWSPSVMGPRSLEENISELIQGCVVSPLELGPDPRDSAISIPIVYMPEFDEVQSPEVEGRREGEEGREGERKTGMMWIGSTITLMRTTFAREEKT
ncbi:hypothetical protein PT974_07087 [Cladobotryum mycophilum]|uniref:Uncharacterized protein n=1 Tax=Cladobotryum mycophilum TaxID=491253 RepID=A0ABR0SNC9_9HYPO